MLYSTERSYRSAARGMHSRCIHGIRRGLDHVGHTRLRITRRRLDCVELEQTPSHRLRLCQMQRGMSHSAERYQLYGAMRSRCILVIL
jgi:hypothetical protein